MRAQRITLRTALLAIMITTAFQPMFGAAAQKKSVGKSQISQKTRNGLAELDIGKNVDYFLTVFGPPIVKRRLASDSFPSFPGKPELRYYRYSFSAGCDLQLFADGDGSLKAFAVHGCGYQFPFAEWKLGITPFAKINERGAPPQQLSGGDGKFPAYVEKQYFGRAGHYSNFYFAVPYPAIELDEATLREVNLKRSTLIPIAVAISKLPGDMGLKDVNEKQWDDFMAYITGVAVARFEE